MDIKTNQGEIVSVTPGEPTLFLVASDFSLTVEGRLTPLTLGHGDTAQFDGLTLTYNGMSYSLPKIAGAVKQGWLITPGGPEQPTPVSAGVQVRPAEGGNPKNENAKTVLPVIRTDTSQVATLSSADGKFQHGRTARGMPVTSDSQGQEGVPVMSLRTPARSRNDLHASDTESVIRDIENMTLQAKPGPSRSDMMSAMSDSQREAYLAEINARKAAKVPTKLTQEGSIQIKTTTSLGSSSIFDAGSVAAGKPVESVVYQDGIKLTNTNGPKTRLSAPVTDRGSASVVGRVSTVSSSNPQESGSKDSASGNYSMAQRIALSLCADFPQDYDFGETPRRKVARLISDFEDRIDVIRAAMVADQDPAVKEKLLQEFPDILS